MSEKQINYDVSITGLTASRVLTTDANKVLTSSTITTTELEAIGGGTPGVVTASKNVIVDSNKDIGDFRNLDAVNIDAGVSGTAGTVDIFPTTASKGKLILSATDNTGDTNVTITNAAHGQATVLTIPDSGLATSYIAQSTSALTVAEVDVLDGATAGTQVASKAVVADANINTGVSKVTELHIGATGAETQVTSTAAELNLLDAKTLSGSDTSIITGTAGTNGKCAQWNADGDIVDGQTIPASDIVGLTDSQALSNKTLTSPIINVTSDAHGDVYFRNTSGGFSRLAPGTSGKFLKTQGAAADPLWDTPAGSGDTISPGTNTDLYIPNWNGADSKTLADGHAFLDEDAMGSDSATGIASQQSIKAYVDGLKADYDTIYVDAGAMTPCTTNGAATGTNEYATNDIEWDYFAFDGGATEERIQFKLALPDGWDLGTIKVKFYWSSATSSTAGDTVEWGIKAGALADSDAIDTALGTPQVISDALLANNGTDLQISPATPALTIAGTPALGELITFEIYRNTDGTDDMTEDAWLLGVSIQYKKLATATAIW